MKRLFISGGTGTAGRAFVRHFLKSTNVSRIVIYSRDEQKQSEMAHEFASLDQNNILRFMLGDVRDESRLHSAMRNIDTVIHTAALKIVPSCEYSPIEAISTNIGGAENIVRTSIACGVEKVIALSTDKCVLPQNLYGATKLVAERLFIAANHLSGSPGGKTDATRFSIIRYGNVSGSRGSVIPLFKKLHAEGRPLPITHPEMTRFWITIDQAVAFVVQCLSDMQGGEVFIPRMPSFRIMDLAMAIVTPAIHDIVGIRPGEKVHETLITPHDVPQLYGYGNHFVIEPSWRNADVERRFIMTDGHGSDRTRFPADFTYASDTNDEWLSVDQLRDLVR